MELDRKVQEYLNEKFARNAFSSRREKPHHFTILGIKRSMWLRVVKPELERIADENDFHLHMIIEKPSNQLLEFEFIPIRAVKPVRLGEPPLTDSELRKIRLSIIGIRDPGPR